MLFADATALIALGEPGWIPLLRHFDAEVIIGVTVRSEVIRSAPQISDAIDQGWLTVRAAKTEQVLALQDLLPALDRGEAETIAILREARPRQAWVVVDERAAFGFLLRLISQDKHRIELICLAQILHRLDEQGVLPLSAADAMTHLLTAGHYGWAKNVRASYLSWCEQHGKLPLPG